ncbi:hypothetical protein M153_10002114 [Pseudoloma neurophilia]|uniref:Uncharacterized protein n=1 Tax=Pseudoloma neurophilia TaxID=146866 RepID=A0A0R0M1D4_9MICR|nr:hypothetical protein M153_10002114 [Pseudoloma neurophilia]
MLLFKYYFIFAPYGKSLSYFFFIKSTFHKMNFVYFELCESFFHIF